LSPHLHVLSIANIKQSKKRKNSYAQKTPRRKSPTLGLNPYAPIGQSQETPQQIAAKRERAAFQRGHRTIARAGCSPSPTPNMSQLMAGHIAGLPPMPSTNFVCDICSLPRPVTIRSAAAAVCVYCQQPPQASITMELMWCIVGEHEVPRNGFTRPASSLESFEMCNPCYFQGLDQEQQEEENDDDIRPRASPVSSYQPSSRHDSVASELGRFTMSSSPAGSRSNSPVPARVLDTTDPPIDFNMQNNDAEAPALSEQDWQYLKDFQARLAIGSLHSMQGNLVQ
jgi:hypothetical protein